MKKIQLQEWALLAEVLGAIAVVVTLIFLVLETRANTNAIQAQTYQALTSELNAIRRENVKPAHISTYLKYAEHSYAELSDEQKYLLITTTEALWGIYESAYYAKGRGVLGENEWSRFEAAICRNYKVDKTLWYPSAKDSSVLDLTAASGIAANVTPKFRQYVESFCQ